jgi:two-component system KDP operon response regulator KdpE
MPAVPAHRRERSRSSHYGDLVLVATDDVKVRRLLCDKLDDGGYRAVIADSATRIEDLVVQLRPLVILLDLDTADGERMGLVSRIRGRAVTQVIVLSSRTSEGDKVSALDAGADDYIAKPFGPKELLARIRVAVRRARMFDIPDGPLEVGPITIDRARHRVTVGERDVHLTPLEFRLVELLARFRGRVVTREQLLHELWGTGTHQGDPLRVHVAAVRRKLEPEPGNPRWLITVVGVGYRLGD